MPSTHRRAFLTSLGSAAAFGLAGCSQLQSEEPPAGSLRFENDHDLPHSVAVEVTDVGENLGDGPNEVTGDPPVPPSQRTLSASTALGPGESETYRSVFTEAVWYVVRFAVDGQPPEGDAAATEFHPVPPGEETGRTLTGRVYESGEFSWIVSSTDNRGRFDG